MKFSHIVKEFQLWNFQVKLENVDDGNQQLTMQILKPVLTSLNFESREMPQENNLINTVICQLIIIYKIVSSFVWPIRRRPLANNGCQ